MMGSSNKKMYAWLVRKNAVSFCGMEKNIFLVEQWVLF